MGSKVPSLVAIRNFRFTMLSGADLQNTNLHAGDRRWPNAKNGDQDGVKYNRSRHQEGLPNGQTVSEDFRYDLPIKCNPVLPQWNSTAQSTLITLINQIRLRLREREIQTSLSQTI
jgi:hypothetical protein